MKLLREFMFGKYKQYLADQERLKRLDEAEACARHAIDAQEALLGDLTRYHKTLIALQGSDVSRDYREAVGDVSAIFMAVISPHLRAKP